jgi:hypothetical protein
MLSKALTDVILIAILVVVLLLLFGVAVTG